MLLFSLSFSTHTPPPCGLASSTGISRRQINLRFCTNQFDISIFPFENAVLLFLSQDLVNVWSKYLVKIFETYCVHSSLVDNGLFFKIKRRSGRACCLLSIQWTTSWGEGYNRLKWTPKGEKMTSNICLHFFTAWPTQVAFSTASSVWGCWKWGEIPIWSIVYCVLPYFSVVFVSFTNLSPGQQSWWQTRPTW